MLFADDGLATQTGSGWQEHTCKGLPRGLFPVLSALLLLMQSCGQRCGKPQQAADLVVQQQIPLSDLTYCETEAHSHVTGRLV